MDEKDSRPPLSQDTAEAPTTKPDTASERFRRGLRGAACAPPPIPPPEYLRRPLPMYPARPDGWVCRACTEWWEWHPYRPPTEQELDEPCVKCRKSLDAAERAVEVNRHLLARLNARPSPLAAPIPSAPTAPARQQRKTGSELLSKKAAARRLGVDRATTLEGLIASGHIKTVPFKNGVRIPVAEVERILNEGIPPMDASRPRARRPIRVNTPKPSDSPGDEIRKLKF